VALQALVECWSKSESRIPVCRFLGSNFQGAIVAHTNTVLYWANRNASSEVSLDKKRGRANQNILSRKSIKILSPMLCFVSFSCFKQQMGSSRKLLGAYLWSRDAHTHLHCSMQAWSSASCSQVYLTRRILGLVM
jgi:hypothetical protein